MPYCCPENVIPNAVQDVSSYLHSLHLEIKEITARIQHASDGLHDSTISTRAVPMVVDVKSSSIQRCLVHQSTDIPLRKFSWCLGLNLFRISRKGLSLAHPCFIKHSFTVLSWDKLVSHHLLHHITTDMTNMHVYVCNLCNDVTSTELATLSLELHGLHVLASCALVQLSNVFCSLLFVLSFERFTPQEIPPVFMLHSDLQLMSALYYKTLCWFQSVLTFDQIQASIILALKSASAFGQQALHYAM